MRKSSVSVMPAASEEQQQLIGGQQYRTYNQRWFLLLVTSILACSNAMNWLCFAPIASETARYFKISMDQVNWLSMVYLIIGIPFGFGTTWLLDTFGIKVALILSSWLNMAGCLVQYFSVAVFIPKDNWKFPILMIGQTLSALAQPLVLFCPTKLAAVWFPEQQRATANMISSMANPLGILFANIVSPMLVKKQSSIATLIGVYAIPAIIACFLATVGIRRKAPPTPPSAGALNSTSEPFLTGMRMLLKNKAYLILMTMFGAGIGIFTAFSALLQQILCVKGYSDSFAGLCGALFIVCGIPAAFLLGLYVDKTKMFVESTKVNFCLTALANIGFALVSGLRGQFYVLPIVCSLFGFFGFSIYPVSMELAVECSYPVGEATAAGFIFISGQLQGVLFIALFRALAYPVQTDGLFSTCEIEPGKVLDWTVSSFVMAGICTLAACCFVIFFHTEYKRMNAEENDGKVNGNIPETG